MKAKLRVLVADGSAHVRKRISDAIEESGVAVVVSEAGNGVTAVADILRLKPDVVMLDIHLPEGNGIQVLKTVRANNSLIKVIVLAWSSDPLYREACMALGADEFLNKTSEFYRIVEILEDLDRKMDRLVIEVPRKKTE